MIQEGSSKLASVPSGGGGGAAPAAAGGAAAAAGGEAAPKEEEKEEEKEESDEDVILSVLTYLMIRWVSDCSIRVPGFMSMIWVPHSNDSLLNI